MFAFSCVPQDVAHLFAADTCLSGVPVRIDVAEHSVTGHAAPTNITPLRMRFRGSIQGK